MPNESLDKLIEKARTVRMTDEQLKAQRRSFVYGNTHIENPAITRELVREVDEEAEIKPEKRPARLVTAK